MSPTRFLLRVGFLAALPSSLSLLAACGETGRRVSSEGPSFHGVALATPITKPAFTLTDFDGKRYDFVRETDGKVALLFFGYTHCPDVCPLHMANIAAVLKQMPWEERSVIRVVFVTTDPERDTPTRLKEWLGNFDPSFVGLTGSKEELSRLQTSLGLRAPQREIANGDSANYFVGHAAQVFAFARDGLGYLEYPFGIRQEDWANDLPQLARDSSGADVRRQVAVATPSSRATGGGTPEIPSATAGLEVTQAVIAEPPSQSEAALYLTLHNSTPRPDTLVAVASDVSARAELHKAMGTDGMRGMEAVRAVPLPPGTEIRFVPGGQHIMLIALRKKLAAGDSATIYLSLSGGGSLQARARVVAYADLQRVLR